VRWKVLRDRPVNASIESPSRAGLPCHVWGASRHAATLHDECDAFSIGTSPLLAGGRHIVESYVEVSSGWRLPRRLLQLQRQQRPGHSLFFNDEHGSHEFGVTGERGSKNFSGYIQPTPKESLRVLN